MVTIVQYFDPKPANDFYWRDNINFHIYEQAERAKGPKSGGFASGIAEDSVEFRIRIEKARALDRARKQMIETIHEKELETFYSAPIHPTEIKRSVDGVENKTDNQILF